MGVCSGWTLLMTSYFPGLCYKPVLLVYSFFFFSVFSFFHSLYTNRCLSGIIWTYESVPRQTYLEATVNSSGMFWKVFEKFTGSLTTAWEGSFAACLAASTDELNWKAGKQRGWTDAIYYDLYNESLVLSCFKYSFLKPSTYRLNSEVGTGDLHQLQREQKQFNRENFCKSHSVCRHLVVHFVCWKSALLWCNCKWDSSDCCCSAAEHYCCWFSCGRAVSLQAGREVQSNSSALGFIFGQLKEGPYS